MKTPLSSLITSISGTVRARTFRLLGYGPELASCHQKPRAAVVSTEATPKLRSVSASRGLLRGRQGHVGGPLRKKIRLLARLRRCRGGPLPRLRRCGRGLRPTPVRCMWKRAVAHPSAANKGLSVRHATPNAPPPLLLFSKTSCWKTLAIVSGHLPFQRCSDLISCASESFWVIWPALLMRPSRS